MGIFTFFRGKVYGLRKKYDRIREKTDRLKDKEKKVEILRYLDQIEPTIVMLEERSISRFEKRRMIRNVRGELEKAKYMLEEAKDKHKEQSQQYQQQQMQRR